MTRFFCLVVDWWSFGLNSSHSLYVSVRIAHHLSIPITRRVVLMSKYFISGDQRCWTRPRRHLTPQSFERLLFFEFRWSLNRSKNYLLENYLQTISISRNSTIKARWSSRFSCRLMKLFFLCFIRIKLISTNSISFISAFRLFLVLSAIIIVSCWRYKINYEFSDSINQWSFIYKYH